MGVPTGEFRTTSITLTEPVDRTTAGTKVDSNNPLDFGTINNTGGTIQTMPKVIWWRCTDMSGNAVINNMKFWLSSNSDLVGDNEYYCDITSTWTQNKILSQVSGGTPGSLPQASPVSNITKMSGADISGINHANTSQYIYLGLSIGADETIGAKGGNTGGFQVSLKFDYA